MLAWSLALQGEGDSDLLGAISGQAAKQVGLRQQPRPAVAQSCCCNSPGLPQLSLHRTGRLSGRP